MHSRRLGGAEGVEGDDGDGDVLVRGVRPRDRAGGAVNAGAVEGSDAAGAAGGEVVERYDLAVIVDQVESYLAATLRDHAPA